MQKLQEIIKMMFRRVNRIEIFLITLSLFLLLFFAMMNFNFLEDIKKETKPPKTQPIKSEHAKNNSGSDSRQLTQETVTIEDVLSYQRQQIADEMKYYKFPNGQFGIDANNLRELTPETGGTPMRSIIITTWRSGSSFLGDVLNALPGNFYYFEPLLTYDMIQIRGPPHDKPALESIKKLLWCNYTEMDEYLEFAQKKFFSFKPNSRLWSQCKSFPNLCYQSKFIEPFCNLFPLQSMKTVRLRMNIAASLLEDQSLNVRIVLLIRDPRGCLQSRKHREWCPGNPDCDDPNNVCKDMVSDFESAVVLSKKFPMTFKVVRYEDLSLSPYNLTQEILQFYGLPFDKRVSDFLDTHTKTNVGGGYSTARDSKSTPFHWTKDLQYNEVKNIQDSCKEAMRLWGYKEASNASELLQNFDPLLTFPDFDVA